MREIKFRAWNTKSGRRYMDNDFFIGSDGTIYDRASRTYDTPNLEIESVSGMTLMQFTGLLDKSGKEIYEGDVLLFRGKQIGPVVFKFAEFVVEEFALSPQAANSTEVFEIIGNIYENPELLKGSI